MARSKSSLALKGLQFFLTFIEFLCAALILTLFSYFLATLTNHHLHIDTYIRAVEGISGVAVVFTLLGLVFLWCAAGVIVFALVAIVLDVAFACAFIYTAYVTRGGTAKCTSYVNTPFGSGFGNTQNKVTAPNGGITILPSLKQACQMEKATFAVAIIAIFFFLISAFVEVLLMKNHRKEKRFGPSPANNYTSGSKTKRSLKFWSRKPKSALPEKNPNALPPHSTPADIRDSYVTESTAVAAPEPVAAKYGHGAYVEPHGTAIHAPAGSRPGTGGAGGLVGDGYAAPMGTHTAAGHGVNTLGSAPYPETYEHGVASMPSVKQHGGVNAGTNY